MRKRSFVLSALILSQTLVFANENQEHHHKATNISDAITQVNYFKLIVKLKSKN